MIMLVGVQIMHAMLRMDKTYSVSDVNKYIKSIIENKGELQNIQVAGELSNFKQYPSGHCYFNLKDNTGVLKGVMWRSRAQYLRFEPHNGDKVIAVGRIRVYERDGVYQIEADILQPQGRGDLMQEYEKLKAKLTAEGLFDSTAKQKLPINPRIVGIVTSSAGAAVRDIITVSRRRDPGIKLYLYPVKVQGNEASREIADAIKFFNYHKMVDVLIVGRGGGSIEDLWAFNEEITVRAVAASQIPIISAVGHETDFTLCDFAADKRAATPSQAAELAVADVDKYARQVLMLENKLQTLLMKQLEQAEYRVERCLVSWPFREPQRLYQKKEERLNRALNSWCLKEPRRLYSQKEEKLKHLLNTRVFQEPELIFTSKEQQVDMTIKKLQESMQSRLQDLQHKLELQAVKLAGLNPWSALARGYSLSQINDEILTSVEQVSWGQEIVTELADGRVYSVVQEVERKENGSKENC